MPAEVTRVLGFGPRGTLMQRPTVGVVGVRYTFFSAEVNGIVRPAGVAGQSRALIFVKFAVVYLISDIALFVQIFSEAVIVLVTEKTLGFYLASILDTDSRHAVCDL
jgi:hypothetical protein